MSWARYLSEVLGVQSVVLPNQAFAVSEGDETRAEEVDLSSVRLLFIGEPEGAPLMETELFPKMIAAMKLEVNEYQIWELSGVDLAVREKEISPDWIVVSFSKRLSDWLKVQRPRLQMITTYHPLECERDPKLKRPVWEDLKKALEKSGLASRLQS